jgi:uncharacterized protein YbjT (DUF2867 family)
MILVAGGTGFVGSAVAKYLLDKGEEVAILGRDAARIRRAFGDRVEPRPADVRDPASLGHAMDGVDVLINAVQFPTSPIEVPRRGWTFEETDYKGAVNLANAARTAGVQRCVYVSGVGAAPDATKHWFRFKYLAEQHLQQTGMEWVVIRPTWVFGPNDHALNRLLGFTKFLPFLPLFGDGKQDMQPVFIDDVARIVGEATRKPEAVNQVFELGGPEVMSMNDVLKTAMDVAGRRRPILHQPIFVGKLLGAFAGVLPTPPLSADAVDFIAEPAVADTTSLMRVFSPSLTSLRQGLATYLP